MFTNSTAHAHWTPKAMRGLGLALSMAAFLVLAIGIKMVAFLSHGDGQLHAILKASECSLPAYKAPRPDCQNGVADRSLSHPARGTNAPISGTSL
jgi:hypothetical protein